MNVFIKRSFRSSRIAKGILVIGLTIRQTTNSTSPSIHCSFPPITAETYAGNNTGTNSRIKDRPFDAAGT